MTIREVMLRAMSGAINWMQAAEIIGCTDRTVRRWRARYERTAPDRFKLTQLGRALLQLGIEHIVSFSPQARGRSERVNRTLQDRLVNELRLAGIRTVAAANRYLAERFLPMFNATFGRPPADSHSAFVPLGRHDLDQILCHEAERIVARDNTVALGGLLRQIDKQRGRRTCVGLRVLVRRHLDGRHSVWWGPRCLGRYSATGRRLAPAAYAYAVHLNPDRSLVKTRPDRSLVNNS
jgi:Helix-turn-helix domain